MRLTGKLFKIKTFEILNENKEETSNQPIAIGVCRENDTICTAFLLPWSA
jgi:hypothetical protein